MANEELVPRKRRGRGKEKQFKPREFLDVIEGTAGIYTTIAKRVGCCWLTVKRYVDAYPEIKEAVEAEREALLDLSESVIVRNIQLAAQEQTNRKRQVDTSDARYLLGTKGRSRGYGAAANLDVKGAIDVRGNVQVDTSPGRIAEVIRILAESGQLDSELKQDSSPDS